MKPHRPALALLALALTLPAATAAPRPSPLVPDSTAADAPGGVVELAAPVAPDFVAVDGVPLPPGPAYRLRAGAHRLEARRFGYHDFSRDIVVEAGATLRVELALEERPFSLLYFGPSPLVFSPLEPVRDFGFRVELSAPGEATVEVLDAKGAAAMDTGAGAKDLAAGAVGPGAGAKVLWTAGVRVEGPHFFLPWDGRDSAGSPLPPGKYVARLRASDSRQREADATAECAFDVRPPRRFAALGADEGLAGSALLPVFLPRGAKGFAGESGTALGATLLLDAAGACAGLALDLGLSDGSDLLTGSARLAVAPTAVTYESWSGINIEPFYLSWKTLTTDFASYFYVFTDWRLGASFTLDAGAAVLSLGPELWFGDVPAPALELRAAASVLIPLGAGSHLLLAGRAASPDLLTAGFGGRWRAEAEAELSIRVSRDLALALAARADAAPAFAPRELSLGFRMPF